MFTDAAMTGTTAVVGKAINISGKKCAAFQMTWTSTAVGTFSFAQSNHPDACTPDGTLVDAAKFTNLVSPAAFSAQQPAGTASLNATTGRHDIGLFAFADLAGEWLLPIYTNASSTGVAQGYGEAF